MVAGSDTGSQMWLRFMSSVFQGLQWYRDSVVTGQCCQESVSSAGFAAVLWLCGLMMSAHLHSGLVVCADTDGVRPGRP